MESTDVPKPRKTGRPLSFDRKTVLDRAMLSFWQHGYETTSITDLTAAMGISAPSLYDAFGDKKQLFLEAMRRYAGDPAELETQLAAAPTAREAVQAVLQAAAKAFTGETTPKGCLLASAAASGSPAATDVKDAIAEVRRGIAALLVSRITQDIAAGLLPASTDATVLADLAVAVVQGMSILARDGVPHKRLLAIANRSLLAWPDPWTD